jgi:signal transduction histidine kinase
MGGVFAFFGVGRERSANRLNQIASWPKTSAQVYAETDDHWLTSSLAHIAATLQVPRILIVWEIVSEPYLFTIFFAEGKCKHDRVAAGTFDNLVPVELQDVVFASTDVKLKEYFTATGPNDSADQVVDKTLQTKYNISSACSAPFSSDNCKGRLFLLDRPDWGQEDLSLAEIVTAHLGNEIEYYAIWTQLEETAANRERMRLFRDLHDGTLQSLTAAALQLKMIADHSDEKSRGKIDHIRRLILGEQRRIRAFVDERHFLSSEQPVKVRNIIQRKIKNLESQWNCLIRLSVTPQDAILPNEIVHQIEFLIAEAVANAVQHGEASSIDIAIEWAAGEVKLRIVDEGHGLPGILGSYSLAQLANLGIGPQSILKRITNLRGTILLISSRNGVELFITIACDNNAHSKNKDHALA